MQQIYILLSQVCLAAVVKNGQGIWNHTECHLGLLQQALAVIHMCHFQTQLLLSSTATCLAYITYSTVAETTMTSPQTFQCTAFSVYRGSVIEEQRHTTVGSEQTDPPVQILLCGGRSGLAWGIKTVAPCPH